MTTSDILLPTTEYVRSADGTAIAYERLGTGPALVLVDGACGSRDNGPARSLAAHLATDFTVVAYDRRGRGDSHDTDRYAVEREVEDLAALVDAIGGSAFAHGVSSGALLVLQAAAVGVDLPRLSLLEPPMGHGCHGEAVDRFLAANPVTLATVARVPAPTLVVDSAGSSEELAGGAAAVVGALPHGEHRRLPGQWHRVADADLAPVLAEFFLR